MWWPEETWTPGHVNIHLTGGPDRIYDDNPTPPLPTRPVGFRIPKEEPMDRWRVDKGALWWWTTDPRAKGAASVKRFDTHAEAIAYADKKARRTT